MFVGAVFFPLLGASIAGFFGRWIGCDQPTTGNGRDGHRRDHRQDGRERRGHGPLLCEIRTAIQPWETNRRVIFDHFKRLAERHAVPLWDFSDSEISHRRAYFYNSQHLNRDGARAFSLDLAGRLRKSGFSTITLRAENPSASPTDEL